MKEAGTKVILSRPLFDFQTLTLDINAQSQTVSNALFLIYQIVTRLSGAKYILSAG